MCSIVAELLYLLLYLYTDFFFFFASVELKTKKKQSKNLPLKIRTLLPPLYVNNHECLIKTTALRCNNSDGTVSKTGNTDSVTREGLPESSFHLAKTFAFFQNRRNQLRLE